MTLGSLKPWVVVPTASEPSVQSCLIAKACSLSQAGGPNSDLFPIPWQNLQPQPRTPDKDPAWQQSTKSVKYIVGSPTCTDSQASNLTQQHSTAEPAAYQITEPSLRPHISSGQNLQAHMITQNNQRPPTTMKPCLLPCLNTRVHQAAPFDQEAKFEAPPNQERLQSSNSSIWS